MDEQSIDAKAQLLCLKYQPNPKSWKQQFFQKQQCPTFDEARKQNFQGQYKELNNTLVLAQKLFNEFKKQQSQLAQYQIRKISLGGTSTPRKKTQPSEASKSRFRMYNTGGFLKRGDLQRTICDKPQSAKDVSFSNGQKSFRKQNESLPLKPQTAVQRRNECLRKKQLITPQSSKIFHIPINNVSAKSWAIFCGKTGDYLSGFNQHKSRQIASITKIMTCWVSIQLAEKLRLQLDDTKFMVPDQAERVGGTTANLLKGDQISIRDLLYGLMLPSGNDAAVTLASNFQMFSKEEEMFIKEMNRWAENFDLSQTRFANVHGLANDFNNSSAYDVGKMAYHTLKHPQFQSIVRTKIYFSEVEDQYGESRELFWENTNKMLYQGFKGVKTGITQKAGPCVVEYFEDEKSSFIIVLLNCSSQEERWSDALKLLEWAQRSD